MMTPVMPRRLNLVAMVVSLFVPWLLFVLTYGNLSFEIRYVNTSLSYALVLAAAAVVVLFGVLAVQSVMKIRSDPSYEPTWYIFLFVTALLWLIAGVLQGNSNFWTNMQAYYDCQHLARYMHVNPAAMRGQELMDGGRMFFTNETRLDLSKAMSFKNDHTYCVTPITVSTAPLATYDFWAVGKDCCNANATVFECGAYSSNAARSGLRVVNDDDRPFYRLAVQQAEGAFNIKAIHPLFYEWVEDADQAMELYRTKGYQAYMIAMIVSFVIQGILVYTASYFFATTEKFYQPRPA